MKHSNRIKTYSARIQYPTGKDLFKDHVSLPGGFVNEGELVEEATKRETSEQTSLTIEPIEIVGVYSVSP